MHMVFFMLTYRTLMDTVYLNLNLNGLLVTRQIDNTSPGGCARREISPMYTCSMTNVYSVLGLKTRLCGHKPPVGSYVTSGNTLTVYFQSDVYRQEDGFEIVFTAFYEGLMYPKPHSILISFLHAHTFSLKHVTVFLSMLIRG